MHLEQNYSDVISFDEDENAGECLEGKVANECSEG